MKSWQGWSLCWWPLIGCPKLSMEVIGHGLGEDPPSACVGCPSLDVPSSAWRSSGVGLVGEDLPSEPVRVAVSLKESWLGVSEAALVGVHSDTVSVVESLTDAQGELDGDALVGPSLGGVPAEGVGDGQSLERESSRSWLGVGKVGPGVSPLDGRTWGGGEAGVMLGAIRLHQGGV